jgi:8-oxo-dGTP pyrophosphatase MutT (NUDIX family)
VGDDDHFVGKITQKAILFGPDDRILLTRRGDRWRPAGGRFEFGETLVASLRRELREELGVDVRVGPPVEAIYGGWADSETGNPMVTLLYRCETDERDVTLNDEHDDYEWVDVETAATRLDERVSRLSTAVRRAAALGGDPPFEAVADPYAAGDVTAEDVLDELAAARESPPPDHNEASDATE